MTVEIINKFMEGGKLPPKGGQTDGEAPTQLKNRSKSLRKRNP